MIEEGEEYRWRWHIVLMIRRLFTEKVNLGGYLLPKVRLYKKKSYLCIFKYLNFE